MEADLHDIIKGVDLRFRALQTVIESGEDGESHILRLGDTADVGEHFVLEQRRIDLLPLLRENGGDIKDDGTSEAAVILLPLEKFFLSFGDHSRFDEGEQSLHHFGVIVDF